MKERIKATHFIEQYNPIPEDREYAPFTHTFTGPYPMRLLEEVLSHTYGSLYTIAIFKIKFHKK